MPPINCNRNFNCPNGTTGKILSLLRQDDHSIVIHIRGVPKLLRHDIELSEETLLVHRHIEGHEKILRSKGEMQLPLYLGSNKGKDCIRKGVARPGAFRGARDMRDALSREPSSPVSIRRHRAEVTWHACQVCRSMFLK